MGKTRKNKIPAKNTRKGGLELGEIIIVLILLVGILAGSMYLGAQKIQSITPDTRTTDEILDGGLGEIEQRFLAEVESGDYDKQTYRWMMGEEEDLPDTIPAGQEGRLYSDMLFNGSYITGIRGLAFRVYHPTAIDYITRIRGFGVFLGETTPLDQFIEDDETFTLDFFPWPVDRKFMEGCYVTSTGTYRTENDTIFRTYFFDCAVMWEGQLPSTSRW